MLEKGLGNRYVLAAAVAVAAAMPLLFQALGNDFLIHIGVMTGINVILALGLNVILGYAGLLNLGFAAYYAAGAYCSMLVGVHFGLSFWINLPLTAVFTGLWGAVLGIPALRLKGDYYAIVSLGLVEITRIVLNNWDEVTNGPRGLPAAEQTLAPASFFGRPIVSNLDFYYLTLVLVVGLVAGLRRLERSRIGMTWLAVKGDEIAAEAMGVNLAAAKTLAAGVGCFFAGIAGTVYTYKVAFITPEAFDFWNSVLLLCMVVLGGMGSVWGILLGAALIFGIPEWLRMVPGSAFTDYRMLVFGAAMAAMVIFRPAGIIPAVRPRLAPRGGRPPSAVRGET